MRRAKSCSACRIICNNGRWTGEGRSDFSPVLGSFSSFWQVPGLGCREAEPKCGGTRKLRPVDYLSREDLWIPDSTDTGAPGPHITAALPGLWWPDHHRSGFDSSFPRALHQNCQLKDMLSLLFPLFSDQGFLFVLTLSRLHLWPKQFL